MNSTRSAHGWLRTTSVATFGLLAMLTACENETQDKPPVVVPPKTAAEAPKWLADATARCALSASCASEHDPPRFADPSLCVSVYGQRLARGEKDRAFDCLASAKTCDAARACIREGEDARAANYCGSHPGVLSACDGDTLVSCNGDDRSEGRSDNCAEMGASCKESNVAGGLVVRACFSDKLCPKGAPSARCDGDSVIACRDGAVERTRCGAGTKCVAHGDGAGEQVAACETGSRVTCTELDGKVCDGDHLVECVSHGHAGRVRVTDCSAAGLVCVGRGARAGCFVPTGVACEGGPATCDGDALSFCASGQMAHVSCTQLGGTCSPAANGPHAACALPPGK